MSRWSALHRAVATAALAAILATCSGDVPESSPASAPATTQVITPDGWGPLRIGMTRAQAVAAAGDDANPCAVGGPDPDRCDEFRPSSAPDGVLVMIEHGVLTRISVSRSFDIRTPEGFGIGDAGSSVLESEGSRARVEPHQYWAPPAKYITIWRESPPTDARRGIRYEVGSNDEIVHIHAGGPSIERVEGCV
jgi:hypothetical protein